MKINNMRTKSLFQIIIISAFIIISAIPSSFAIPNTTSYCIDSNVLFTMTAYVTKTGNSAPKDNIINQTTVCPTGCSSNSCNPDSSVGIIIVFFIIIITVLTYFAYLKPRGLLP